MITADKGGSRHQENDPGKINLCHGAAARACQPAGQRLGRAERLYQGC
jgi:hypothetical protein